MLQFKVTAKNKQLLPSCPCVCLCVCVCLAVHLINLS